MNSSIVLFAAFNLLFDDENEDEMEIESRIKVYKNMNYAEDVVPMFSDQTFKEHFRVTPSVFEVLCSDLHEIWSHEVGPGRNSIVVEKQLMITLWYLGNQESMRSIADRFGVCIATVWRCVTCICEMIIKLNRVKRFIRWPTPAEATKTSDYYAIKYRFKGIVGSIDGSHIPIRAPIISHNSYINRKGFHSVLLQGVCNQNLEFMYCYTGEAGSIHDSLLLTRSGLIDKINSGEFNIAADQHLLGDSAYPLKNWIITPFKDLGHITDEQKIFNRVHSKCRVSIERAFGMLKGRFRRLFGIDCLKPVSIVKYIVASCILHNICTQNNDNQEDYTIEDDIDSSGYEDLNESFDLQNAHTKRNSLLNSLF